MERLEECHRRDKRKLYHTLKYASNTLKYAERYPNDPLCNQYIENALLWLVEANRERAEHRGIRNMMKQITALKHNIIPN